MNAVVRRRTMWWVLLALLAIVLVVGYAALINGGPVRCPACRRVNVFRRPRTGARRDERDAEDILSRTWTEVACSRCGARYWLVWDDFEGTRASLDPPPNAAAEPIYGQDCQGPDVERGRVFPFLIHHRAEGFMSESAAAIREFLARRVMDTGYATQFADAICLCGCREFSLEVDEEVGEAWWFCQACNAAYLLHDADGPVEGSPDYEAVDCVCTCDQDKFEIAVGVTLYGQSDTARTAYIGCKCVACGRVECYASWPRVDAPYLRFFGTMKHPRA